MRPRPLIRDVSHIRITCLRARKWESAVNVQDSERKLMEVRVNGTLRQIDDDLTVAELLELVDAPTTGVAVAVDGSVVPRAAWPTTSVHDGAVVEILTAVQGG
jgi:sulfur carrier protein